MKISEMNKILKEMKSIVNYKDTETEIDARGEQHDPYYSGEILEINTTINDIAIRMVKRNKNNDKKNQEIKGDKNEEE